MNTQPIQNILILGAGGLGAVYANLFHQAGFNTKIVAKGERYERLTRDGFWINDVNYQIPIINAAETDFTADLIFVGTKFYHLPEALPDLANFVGEHTLFISLLNGLTSEELIGDLYGRDKTLLAISMNLDAQRVGNRITHSRPPLLIFGEPKNETVSPRVARIHQALVKANINYQTPEDMLRSMWWKFMVNVGMNQSSAVTRATYGRYKTEPQLRWLKENLMREVVAVAQAEGVNLYETDITSFYKTIDIISPLGKTSMLQDIEAGRKTEVDMFAPVVIHLGAKHGIPTPVNQTIYAVISTLEQTE